MKLSTSLPAFIFLSFLFLAGCNGDRKYERMKNELMDVDRAFSDLSLEIGSHASFLEYIDDSCVLLRPNRNPVEGKKNIVEMFSKPDTSFTLKWEPIKADIAASGDLGYTYGIFTIEMDSPEGIAVTKEGTYVTVWKKDKNGNWKFVLDTGNQGLGNKSGATD